MGARRPSGATRTRWEAAAVYDATIDVLVTWPGTSGGFVPSEDELQRTLAFSGTYVSDDGNVSISRSVGQASAYTGDRFVGRCTVCAGARVIPASGEPLADVHAAVGFVSTHDHTGLD
jgi:hypothetical protein